jgi:competence protein ComEC
MPEYGRGLKNIDIVIGLFLLAAILIIGYYAITGAGVHGGLPKSGTVSVHFIDVGQGDSMLVRAGDKYMLVDGGKREAGPKLVEYLKSQGVTSIDVLVSTHPHADHIGGLLDALKAFPVKQVVDSGIAQPTQTYESYLTLIDKLNIPYSVGEAGQTIDLGPEVKVEVLAPPASRFDDSINENCIVLKVTHGSVSFLLMADAGRPEERYLMSSGRDLKSNVFKVPHHGSRFSVNRSFISKVSPEVSVIEVGENKYGHPAPKMLAALGDVGSVVYRTDLNGNVVVTSDGRGFTVTPQYATEGGKQLSCMPSYSGMRCTA